MSIYGPQLAADVGRPGLRAPAGVLEHELPDGWAAVAGRTDAANDYVRRVERRDGHIGRRAGRAVPRRAAPTR